MFLCWTIQVLNAQECGAKGVLLYTDPAEYTHYNNLPDNLYPNSWWLPGWAVQRGTISPVTGDILTPNFPATGMRIKFFVMITS